MLRHMVDNQYAMTSTLLNQDRKWDFKRRIKKIKQRIAIKITGSDPQQQQQLVGNEERTRDVPNWRRKSKRWRTLRETLEMNSRFSQSAWTAIPTFTAFVIPPPPPSPSQIARSVGDGG
ncbi:hypothetical protein B296_00047738 [Ensete ventricosum]|uniref:Uncharacterized protein n=1 Tax=Ensete ventricosum TaxID=4639 RepID=A0A426YY72_ENSVE|nr:hypothetical protein B296_00047738 [Ensete ventricosum]